MIRCLVALALGAITCGARIYTPCELAHYFRFYYSSYIPEKYVPLAVCIAGYHNYSKSNELVHPDGRIFVGYFGLISKPECPKQLIKDDSYFSADWNCLKSQVLDVPEKLNLYEKLCAPKLVKKVTCRFNEHYEYGEVWDPIHKDILSLSYGEESVINSILASYVKKDQQPSTTTEHENTKVSTIREINGITTKPQLLIDPTNPESTNDLTRSYYIQEFARNRPIPSEYKRFEQEDGQFCFNTTQVSLICTLLLIQTLLITGLFYILANIRQNLETPKLRVIPVPSSPPVEEFLRKSYSENPTG